MNFTACFVALNKQNTLKYIAHNMSGQRFPCHTRGDIVGLCDVMNERTKEDLQYVDIFHVLNSKGETVWLEGWNNDDNNAVLTHALTK